LLFDSATWPLAPSIAAFLVSGAVIAFAGLWLARIADILAHRSRLGEAVMGAVFLGATTSLSGMATSFSAATAGHADLAVSNALGGIAAQIAFLAIADIAYPKANLEHAAASQANLVQGALLVALLAVPLIAMTTPDVTVLAVHPASLVIVLGFAFGVRLIARAAHTPMWHPRQTSETRSTTRRPPDLDRWKDHSTPMLWVRFAVLAGLVALAGYTIARSGAAVSAQTGLSETGVGGVFTAVTTSLPELVTAVAAVRRGALILAVSDILGGNCFDVILLTISDIGFRSGSLYHAFTDRHVMIVGLATMLTAILLLGLLRRERHGIANIGFESVLVLVIYAGGAVLMFG
jgi:cation:H+ antiporter